MPTNTFTGQKASGTTEAQTRIEGPIPEFDKYHEYTGYDYYRCCACGAEAIRRRELELTNCEEGH